MSVAQRQHGDGPAVIIPPFVDPINKIRNPVLSRVEALLPGWRTERAYGGITFHKAPWVVSMEEWVDPFTPHTKTGSSVQITQGPTWKLTFDLTFHPNSSSDYDVVWRLSALTLDARRVSIDDMLLAVGALGDHALAPQLAGLPWSVRLLEEILK